MPFRISLFILTKALAGFISAKTLVRSNVLNIFFKGDTFFLISVMLPLQLRNLHVFVGTITFSLLAAAQCYDYLS